MKRFTEKKKWKVEGMKNEGEYEKLLEYPWSFRTVTSKKLDSYDKFHKCP